MTKIYGSSEGEIIYLVRENDEADPESFQGAAYSLEMDLDTNAALVQEISEFPERFRLAGTLTRDGQAVAIAPGSVVYRAMQDARIGYAGMPDWVRTASAADAEAYITSQIFQGYTQAQVNSYIDSTIVNITTANVAQINAQLANIRTALKAVGAAIITMRGLFVITAKLLIYIRDLVIRFRSTYKPQEGV